jgi:Mrp family chromosome partitioning ATPase
LSKKLAPQATLGLSQALTSSSGLTKMLGVRLHPYLEFVPAVAKDDWGDPDAFLGSASMARLLRSAQEDHNVVIDLPPMSESSDALAVGNFLDTIILVVEAGRTTSDELEEALAVLKSLQTPSVRILLNKTDQVSALPQRAVFPPLPA